MHLLQAPLLHLPLALVLYLWGQTSASTPSSSATQALAVDHGALLGLLLAVAQQGLAVHILVVLMMLMVVVMMVVVMVMTVDMDTVMMVVGVVVVMAVWHVRHEGIAGLRRGGGGGGALEEPGGVLGQQHVQAGQVDAGHAGKAAGRLGVLQLHHGTDAAGAGPGVGEVVRQVQTTAAAAAAAGQVMGWTTHVQGSVVSDLYNTV